MGIIFIISVIIILFAIGGISYLAYARVNNIDLNKYIDDFYLEKLALTLFFLLIPFLNILLALILLFSMAHLVTLALAEWLVDRDA